MPTKLHNQPDQDPGCLAASFPVKKTPAHLSAGKQQCGVNDVPALRPAETDWAALQQMVYRRKISDIDQLKRVLIHCWAQLSHDTLNRAID